MLDNIQPVDPAFHDLGFEKSDRQPTGHDIVAQVLTNSLVPIGKHLQARVRDRDEAEEILQEFVLRALEHAGNLRDVHSVRGWLSRVLTSAIVDHHRRVQTRARREIHVAMDQVEAVMQVEMEPTYAVCECAFQVLPTLKPEYAEAIKCLDILAEPRDVVAERLGITINTLTVRLHRARNALKVILEATCAEDCCRDSDFACTCPPT